jgi:hypothetical protein
VALSRDRLRSTARARSSCWLAPASNPAGIRPDTNRLLGALAIRDHGGSVSWAAATCGATVPLYVGYRWWRRHQRERALARELAATNGDAPPIPAHLSPSLAAVAEQSYRLRLELELPVRRIRDPLVSETPWARRHRCDEFDAALYEVRRAVWEWLRMLGRLGSDDRQLLGELGLSVVPFRKILFGCDRTNDVWDQGLWASAPDLDAIWIELRRTILELERLERALVAGAPDPYR